MKGLEPPRLSASDPKSDVATNYTTSATLGFCSRKTHVFHKSSAKVTIFLIISAYGGENFIKFSFFVVFASAEHTPPPKTILFIYLARAKRSAHGPAQGPK